MSRARKTAWVVVLVVLAATGCTKRRNANIIHHPDWQYQDYKRIAVAPFQVTNPKAAEAAHSAELYLIDQLTNSGAFQVASRSDLAAVLKEQDLSRIAGMSDSATALPEGMMQVAQALVIGTITEYDLKTEHAERRIPRYARDRRGLLIRGPNGQPVVTGEDVFVEYRNIARVGGNIRVIDCATGRVLVSRTVPALEKDDQQWNNPPRATPQELALDLARELATEFCRQIAPQSIEVKLSGDCLIIATEYYEGRYDEMTKVPTNFPEILLVARDLPRQCDRNQFRLAISPKDGHDYIVQHEFTWSPSLGHHGEAVTVPMAKLTESGAEKFVAKLFSQGNEEPILQREFSLTRPKKVD